MGQTRRMRRGIAGLLFFISAICLALAAGGWWLQRTAFDPAISRDASEQVFEDPGIRSEVVSAIVASPQLAPYGVDAATLDGYIELAGRDEQLRDVLGDVVAQSHARLIGTQDEPVQITGTQLVPLIRNEAVASLPAVTLPVEEVGILSTIRVALGWFVPLVAGLGALALVLGLLTHPRRADAVFGIGVFCVLGAVLTLLLGYAVPAWLLPALFDEVWVAVTPAVASATLPFLVTAAVVLVLVGIGLMLASSNLRRRRSWSTPVTTSRYADQRRWS